jgi:hypothetical protein
MQTTRSLHIGLWLLLSFGSVGCLPVPLWNQSYGTPVTKEAARLVTVGQTTRPELIHMLGTNYVSLWHESAIAYPWEGGLTFDWTDCSSTGTGNRSIGRDDSVGAWRAFFVTFDTNGVVAAKTFKSLKLMVPLDQKLEDWAGRMGSCR